MSDVETALSCYTRTWEECATDCVKYKLCECAMYALDDSALSYECFLLYPYVDDCIVHINIFLSAKIKAALQRN